MKNCLNLLLFAGILFANMPLNAQMEIDGEILYGNEWINYEQEYLQLTVTEEGIYRVTGQELENAGIDLNNVQGRFLQLYHLGKQIPMFVSDAEILEDDGFIEFYGQANKGEIDKHLYLEWEEDQLNPEYSNFSDEASYFLTWEVGSNNQEFRLSQIVNDLSGNPTAEPYYLHHEKIVFSERHNKPDHTTNNLRYSHFDKSEGFGSSLIRNRTLTFPISNKASSTFKPQVSLRFGSNDTEHDLSVSIGTTELFSEKYNGNKLFQINTEVDEQLLIPQTKVKILGSEAASDKYITAFGEIVYARQFVFPASTSISFTPREYDADQYFEIENFSPDSDLILVYDVESKSRLIANTTTGPIRFKLPFNDSENRKVFVYDYDDGVKTVDRIEKKNFINYTTANPSYVVLTSNKFEGDAVSQYTDYRGSELGGGYNTLTVHVEQLYDQYGYGITRNPISIRNFFQERKSEWEDLEFVFIIGKAIEYSNYRTEEDIGSVEVPFYVPTWGAPGADNLMFSRKGFSAPIAAIGRIAARNELDISNYLDKVFTHEQFSDTDYSLESREWTKSILHLSGGDIKYDLDEQIFEKLGDMKDIIETSSFGGNVTTYRKTSSDPLQTATSSEILEIINEGKSVITFFGHSGAGTFDFSLEDVDVWENYQKYPVILSMGCHSGNVHGENINPSLSEDFVLTPEKGALAFIASSSTATFTALSTLGPKYYENFGNIFHNDAIAKSIKSYLEEYDDIPQIGFKILNQQLTFHGDPAIVLYPQNGPDYIVDIKSIGSEPADITIIDQTYDINFDVVNLGKYIDSDLKIVLSHYLPDGSLFKTYNKIIPAPAYRTRISIPIVNAGLLALGKNRIDIEVDVDNDIAERPLPYAEDNNLLSNITEENGYNYFITGSTVIPVYPPEFAIVNDSDITFIASGVNAFRSETKYQIQLDTSELFESPLLNDEITLSGGTVKWNPNFNYQNDIVYYWRVTPLIEDEELQWQNSSFIYLSNETTGWNQSHYYQFLKDDLTNAHFEDRTLEFPLEYEENTLNLFVPDGTTVRPRYKRANTSLGAAKLWEIPKTGICVLIREPKILSYIENTVPGLYGSWSINSTRRIFFFETQNQQSRIDLVNFLYDVVESGHHVFLNTIHNNLDGDLHTLEWADDANVNGGRNIFTFLESQGAELIRNIEGLNTHYAMFFTKDVKLYDEVLGAPTLDGEINASALLSYNALKGNLESTLIGPSLSWHTLNTKVSDIEQEDTFDFDVYGIDTDGNRSLLYENLGSGLVDLSEISAAMFPFIQLDYSATDSLNRTMPLLDYWRVYHTHAPEAIYESSEILEFNNPSLQQGQQMTFNARIANIIDNDMDSLLVRYTITDDANTSVESFIRNEPLLGLDKNMIAFNRSTLDLTPGNYQFIAELNPLNDQIEQYHFNNFAITQFGIKRDILNPLLDVTFNDVHIDNNAVISSDPEIKITLRDENPYLILDDINSFQVAITHPDGTREDIDLNADERISFTPGTTTLNQAQIIFLPEFLQEGVYEFYAQAKDKSDNFSGDVEYRVNFQIIFENKITDVLLCPNPLQGEAFFKFSLEGKILPSPFEIRIYSIDGQLVELIQTDRLGHVLIEGVNLVPWDGTSASGEPLASGAYFFKFGFIPDHYRNNLPEIYFKDAFGSFIVITQE